MNHPFLMVLCAGLLAWPLAWAQPEQALTAPTVQRIMQSVVGVHIDERLIPNGIYDTANAGHILRGGGPADYFSIGPEQLFKMYRPASGARDLPK